VRAVSSGSPADDGAVLTGPEVYPMGGATDLLGRMPVRLRSENHDLVAYGFENQRILIPAAEIGGIAVHRGWGKQWGRSGPALMVLDSHDRVLLRAPGAWGAASRRARSSRSYGVMFDGLIDLCDDLGIGRPKGLTPREVRRQKERWRRAPGYHRLRVRSRGLVLTKMALVLLDLLLAGCGIAAAVALAKLLPSDVGAVRNLIGVVLGAAAPLAAIWLYGFELRALNWIAVSLEAGTLAPPDRFFGARYRRHGAAAGKWLTALMAVAIPVLIGWGPVIGLVSLAHGFADQALVTSLRQNGATAMGYNIDVPTYSTDSNGDIEVFHHPTLEFLPPGTTAVVQTPDPAIAGWTWPMNQRQLVTIVYDQADPRTAAVAGQISGSPWHGAPTGNIVSGAVLTAALVPLTWLTVRRIRIRRRESREGLFDAIG
jgi:hypothetical protein